MSKRGREFIRDFTVNIFMSKRERVMATKTGFLFILVGRLFKIRVYVGLWVFFKFKNQFCYLLKIGFLQFSLRSVNFCWYMGGDAKSPLLAGVS